MTAVPASGGRAAALAGRASGEGLRLVRLTSFEPAAYVAPEHREAHERRFSTLLVDEASARRGGIGEVVRALNPRGERFAVKRLRLRESDGDLSDALRATFEAEYDAHRALASLRGFPRLFGRGIVDGEPAIVMEWIDGVTLEEAARSLAVDDEGRLSPLTAARIGRDLFDLLASMAYLDRGLAHRDVSLRNVMVDTSRLSLADQVEEGSFQLVLIDFGSAAVLSGGDSSLTGRFGAMGGATADFAPPEMLADDGADAALRRSPAVDVYAAAGVVYALLEGHPPYDLSYGARAERGGLTAARLKAEFAAPAAEGAHSAAADVRSVLEREPEVAVAVGRAAAELDGAPAPGRVRPALSAVDGQLSGLLDACLAPRQDARPSAAAVRDALALFCSQYSDNVARALRGDPLADCPLGGGSFRGRRGGRARRAARLAFRALSAAVALGAAAGVGVLVHGMSVSFPADGPWWSGPVPGPLAALVLVLPLTGALAVRGRASGTILGLASGVLGDLLGATVVGMLVALTAWPSAAVEEALYATLLLCAAAPLPLLVADCALAPPRAIRPRAGAAARPVLPWGGGDEAAPDGLPAASRGAAPELESESASGPGLGPAPESGSRSEFALASGGDRAEETEAEYELMDDREEETA